MFIQQFVQSLIYGPMDFLSASWSSHIFILPVLFVLLVLVSALIDVVPDSNSNPLFNGWGPELTFWATLFVLTALLIMSGEGSERTASIMVSKDKGKVFMDQLPNMINNVSHGYGKYVIYGIGLLPFLWFFDRRSFERRKSSALLKLEERIKMMGETFETIDENRLKTEWISIKITEKLNVDEYYDAKTASGAKRIAKLVVMWPVYTFKLIFLNVITICAEALGKVFGGMLNMIGGWNSSTELPSKLK